MNINAVTLVMIGLLAACSLAGLLLSKKIKSQKSYYVMEGKAPTFVLVGAFCMSYISGITATSGPALSYEQGPFFLLSSAQPGCWLGTIVAILLIGRKWKAIGCYTLPDFFRRRFGSPAVTLVAVIIMTVSLFIYGVSQLIGIGSMLSGFTGIPYVWLILLFTAAILLFSVPAGIWGIMVTDLVLFSVVLVGVLVGCPFIIHEIGAEAVANLPPDFWSLGGIDHLPITNNISQFLIWFLFFSCSPMVVSRVFPARNDFAVLKACVISVALVSVISTLIYLTGGLVRGVNSEISPPETVMVYAFSHYAPPLLAVLGIVAGIMAAISTTALVFNLIGFAFSRDIHQLLKGETSDERRGIRRGRLCQAAAICLAGLGACFKPFEIYNMLSYATGLFAASWLPVILSSLLWRRMNGKAALFGMLAGGLSLTVLQCAVTFGGLRLPDICNQYFISILLSICVILLLGLRFNPNQLEMECHYRLQNVKLTDLLITTVRKSPDRLTQLWKEYKSTGRIIRITLLAALCFWILFSIWLYRFIY